MDYAWKSSEHKPNGRHRDIWIMNTAKLLNDKIRNFTGHAALYSLTPPLKDFDGKTEHKHVVVSSTNAMLSGPETYIFPANESGEVSDWGELPGSQKGTLDHEKALRDAGYAID